MQIFNSFVRIGWKKKVADLLKKRGAGLFYLINLPPFLICEF